VSLCTDSFMDVLVELSSNSLVSKVEVSSSRLKSGCSSVATKEYFPVFQFHLWQFAEHHLRTVSRLVVVGQ
jgi:hypothetical protein